MIPVPFHIISNAVFVIVDSSQGKAAPPLHFFIIPGTLLQACHGKQADYQWDHRCVNVL